MNHSPSSILLSPVSCCTIHFTVAGILWQLLSLLPSKEFERHFFCCTMSRHPEVKWAQRSDKLYITIELPDANNPKVKVEPEGKFSFSARVGKDQVLYEFDLDLLDRVNVKESKINFGLRNIVCIIEKEEKKWWKQLVKTEGKRLPFLKVDWNKWVDEDEEIGEGKDMDFGQMDFSKLGMGGDDDLDYNEPEDEESENQLADEESGQEPQIEDSGKGKAIAT